MTEVLVGRGRTLHMSAASLHSVARGPARNQQGLLIAWSPAGRWPEPLVLPIVDTWDALSLPLGGSKRPWRSHVVGSRCNVQA